MDYRPVRPGDDLKISAKTWNAVLGSLAKSDSSNRIGKTPTPDDSGGCWVRVQNVSDEGVAQYNIMQIVGPTIEPDEEAEGTEDRFKNRLVLNVDKPSDESKGRWCVVQQPLAPKAFGWAIAAGATKCRIDLKATADRYVDMESDSTVPVSGATGAAQILWVAGEVGTAEETGEQWAEIWLGGPEVVTLHVQIGAARGYGKYDATLLLPDDGEPSGPDTAAAASDFGEAYSPPSGVSVIGINSLEVGKETNSVSSGSVWPCSVLRRPTAESPYLFLSFSGFGTFECVEGS